MGIDAIDAIDTIEEGIEGDFLNRGSVSCQNNRPSEALFLASAGSKLRFRLRLSLAWSCPRYAISDGGFAASLPDFLFFSIPPGSISPGTIPAHQSSAIKRAVQKNATLQKSGVRYFSA